MSFWLKRITNIKYFIGLIIGIFIAVLAGVTIILNYGSVADGVQTHITPYTYWISASQEISKLIFFFLIPILSSLSFAQILNTDIASGFFMQTVKRIGISKYNWHVQIGSIVSGALTVGIPLLLNFWVLWIWFPLLKPNLMLNKNMNFLDSYTYFSSLYYSHPFKLVVLYTFLAMLVGGLYSLISVAISCYTDNKFIPLVGGFIITLLLNVISTMSSFVVSPVSISMEFSVATIPPLSIFICILLVSYVVTSLLITRGVRKRATK